MGSYDLFRVPAESSRDKALQGGGGWCGGPELERTAGPAGQVWPESDAALHPTATLQFSQSATVTLLVVGLAAL